MSKAILVLLILGFSAQSSADDSYQEYSKKAQGLVDGIKAIAASDLSCKFDSDCGAMSSGARSCGGPNRFIITSRHNIALHLLKQLITLETELEAEMNEKLDVSSICSVEMKPRLKCEENKCTEVVEN